MSLSSSTTMASLKNNLYTSCLDFFMYKPTTRMWQPTLPSFFKITVLGVLPYLPFNLGFEDSASLKNFVQHPRNKKLDIYKIFIHNKN